MLLSQSMFYSLSPFADAFWLIVMCVCMCMCMIAYYVNLMCAEDASVASLAILYVTKQWRLECACSVAVAGYAMNEAAAKKSTEVRQWAEE